MKQKKPASAQRDAAILSKTLLKLATPRIILRTVVIALCIIVWVVIADKIIDFGKQQDYAALETFSPQLVTYLNSINNYIWWGLILLGSLILYFMVSGWLSSSISKAAEINPPQPVIRNLINSLSQEGKDVLAWAWRDRSEPLKISNIHEALNELRNGRVSKLVQIQEQQALLSSSPIPDLTPPLAEPDIQQNN
ncbi:MAG: hypothetical protein GX070_03750 [Alcaligenaceae bacterium]|nr:hypothetical protein [Alcaligenaceae bacterium]